ncbi:NAD(P)-binding protein [Periconia macrospinosa]|uniref:NAD(P)-binding protein n=1 Tax=Periconia macrospinosa TaxID=97972 RepID=A0A2V1D6W2_9PLEO|nr:NAD(P)-binding protein [Periconia macrospinosa]
MIIGAGYRGLAYAEPIHASGEGVIAAVIDTSPFKRQAFGQKYIWGPDGRSGPRKGESFASWEDYISYEKNRRERLHAGEVQSDPGIDAAFVCVLDELHAAVVKALAPLGMHIMCEKPIATRLEDVLGIYAALAQSWKALHHQTVFAAGYVLRYSPANMLLRKLVRDERVIGDVVSVEHTDTIGWWHFAHSYVRGNWRKEATSAPSLLTKSCHDIDFLLWLLCSPSGTQSTSAALIPPHLPSRVTSMGRAHFFRSSRKPVAAGNATNCLSCPVESTCLQSAKKIYLDRHLAQGHVGKPVNQVVPDIEDVLKTSGKVKAEERLLDALAEDYDEKTPAVVVDSRSWYGRCVWESDNDVCDDQVVTMEWDDDPLPESSEVNFGPVHGRTAKIAQFHMVALSNEVGGRKGRISGTAGEILYDLNSVQVIDLLTGQETVHPVDQNDDIRLDRDKELALGFIRAVAKVKGGGMDAKKAQRVYLDCTVEDLIRSHLVVFWAEAARKNGKVLGWVDWWAKEVETKLKEMGVVV